MALTKTAPPFFDARKLPNPEVSYVAWLDVMGAGSSMLRSLPITANFVFKLHIVALEQKKIAIKLYPVMDGVYIVGTDQNEMRMYLAAVHERLAGCFSTEKNNEHRFLVKCSIAYGPVIHGEGLDKGASNVLAGNRPYTNSILLGMPMVFAVRSEPGAPPFGVFVHPTAEDFMTAKEKKWSHTWWPWFELGKNRTAQGLKTSLPDYFKWCEERAGVIDYPRDRIKVHKAQAEEYLVDA